MARFGSLRALDASLARRQVLLGGLAAAGSALGLAGCQDKAPLTASTTPPIAMDRLTRDVSEIARRVGPGVLGAGLMNLDTAETWTFNGDRPFPMQSVFKAPLGAAVLAEVDAGRLALDEVVSLQDTDLSPPYSPIADAWPQRRDYTVAELLSAAAGQSDNTAADVLMKRIGGPGAVTAWLVSKKIDEVRIDRYERELQPESVGLASFRAGWRGEFNYVAAMQRVPPELRRAALARYLGDPRDTATPRGMMLFLQQLDSGQLISPASARRLIEIMTVTQSAPGRIKAALPAGSMFAHKTGTSRTDLGVTAATNDAGIFTLPNRRSYAIAVFLAGATLDAAARDAAIADVGRAAIRAIG